jgi:hypothetical protein
MRYQQIPAKRTLRGPYSTAPHASIEGMTWEEAWAAERRISFDEAISYAAGEDVGA